MKRLILVGLFIVLIIACVAMRDKSTPANVEAKEASSKPVMVPYLDKTITECSQAYENGSESILDKKMVANMGDGKKAEKGAKNGQEDRTGGDTSESGGDVSGETDPEPEGDDSTVGNDADGSSGGKTYLGEWRITFYCPCEICCGEWANGITSSGAVATPWWTVACDGLADGTIIEIDGLGTFEVQDSGVPYGCIDVFVADHEEALALGMQYHDVYIVS